MDVRYSETQVMPELEVVVIPATKSPVEKKRKVRNELQPIVV